MQPHSITLFLTEGSSDKQYQVQLEAAGDDGFVVNFQNGRRGSTLRARTKTAIPVGYEQAKSIYDSLVKAKLKDGYTTDESGQSFVGTEDAGRDTGVRPMLLNSIDPAHLDALLHDPNWCAQEKYDGERRMVVIDAGQVIATNRRGLAVPMAAQLHAGLAAATFTGRTILDGEDLGDRYVIFDVLCLNGEDLTQLPYRERLIKRDVAALHVTLGFKAAGNYVTGLTFAPTAIGPEQKCGLLDIVRLEGGEGIVFKHLESTYEAGRPSTGGNALKHKLVETCTARVASHKAGKRSVGLELMDANGEWVGVGNVTVPANQAIPPVGAQVEVRYLYAYEGGSLFQPVLLGLRTDLSDADCTLTQLKYKAVAKAA